MGPAWNLKVELSRSYTDTPMMSGGEHVAGELDAVKIQAQELRQQCAEAWVLADRQVRSRSKCPLASRAREREARSCAPCVAMIFPHCWRSSWAEFSPHPSSPATCFPADINRAYRYTSAKAKPSSSTRVPIFSQLILADEVNRATPRTQSALLEAMEEHQVTTEGETRRLPEPFFVVATQNPSTWWARFPLPESQLDRFLMRIELGYPDHDAERTLLQGADRRDMIAAWTPASRREI